MKTGTCLRTEESMDMKAMIVPIIIRVFGKVPKTRVAILYIN